MTDIAIQNHGSIVLLRPCTPAGDAWLDEHLAEDRQRWGAATVCEPRYVRDIVDGARDDGLVVA